MFYFGEEEENQQKQSPQTKLLKGEIDFSATQEKLIQGQNNKKPERYECFCFNQYLSYSALWNHLRKKHIEFFQTNKGFYSTHTVSTVDPVYGYQIRKLCKERVNTKNGNEDGAKGKKAVQNEFSQIQPRQRPQYQFEAIQIQISESLKKNQVKKRTLNINQKILEKEGEVIQELQEMMTIYQGILKLLGIKEITEIGQTKMQAANESQEDFYPDQV